MLRRVLGRCRRRVLDAMLPKGRFACSVCARPVRKFLPLAGYYEEHLRAAGWPYRLEDFETLHVAAYSCPRCGASDRDRLYALYLEEYFRDRARRRPSCFVEFGPSAPLSRFVRDAVARHRLPMSHRRADLLAPDVDDRVDVMDMPTYADASVDFFFCSHVLEHVRDDRRALRELHRILAHDGQGILMVPILLGIDAIDEDPDVEDETERWRRFGQHDHVRLYSRAGFLARVREAGFAVDEWNATRFGADRLERHGIDSKSVLYVVSRQDRPAA